MSFRVEFPRRAARDYANLDGSVQRRIRQALRRLAANPNAGKPLQRPLRNRRSYRVGDYRIIYRVERDKLLVLVLTIGHRREVYKT